MADGKAFITWDALFPSGFVYITTDSTFKPAVAWPGSGTWTCSGITVVNSDISISNNGEFYLGHDAWTPSSDVVMRSTTGNLYINATCSGDTGCNYVKGLKNNYTTQTLYKWVKA